MFQQLELQDHLLCFKNEKVKSLLSSPLLLYVFTVQTQTLNQILSNGVTEPQIINRPR